MYIYVHKTVNHVDNVIALTTQYHSLQDYCSQKCLLLLQFFFFSKFLMHHFFGGKLLELTKFQLHEIVLLLMLQSINISKLLVLTNKLTIF